MEKGVSRYWTPESEARTQALIDSAPTYASRHLMMTIRDMLKYDGRTRASKQARTQAGLRLAVATDQDLDELARLEVRLLGELGEPLARTKAEALERLKRQRAELLEQGFKRDDFEGSEYGGVVPDS